MTDYNSNWIFKLASSYGIPLDMGGISPMGDEEFESFRDEYRKLSKSRDVNLDKYTSYNPTLFRVYLPYSDEAFGLATQIAWYLDEIVIRDPIPSILDSFEQNAELSKHQLRSVLQFIAQFRGLIENEFVLLAGPTSLDNIPDEPSPLAITLFHDENIRSEMERISQWGYSETRDGTGFAHELRLLTGRVISMGTKVDIPPGGMWESPTIDFVNGLPSIGFEELSRKLEKDLLELHKDMFFKEIQRPIYMATNAQKMGAAVLFSENRPIDQLILHKAEVEFHPDKQNASIQALNVALPFVSGIPPDRLMDIRRSSPTAFTDFRARVAELIIEATADATPSQEYLRHRVQKELVPTLGSLESEMNGAIKRAGIMGLGVPLVAGTGVLIGNVLGVPAHVLLGGAIAGALSGVSSLADSVQTSNRAKGHPGYFLWKANKLKPK